MRKQVTTEPQDSYYSHETESNYAAIGNASVPRETPEPTRTFDRFLRFRLLTMQSNGVHVLHKNGVIATYFEEGHDVTLSKALAPLEGDLIEIEYPASYGYFLFDKDGKGEWKYTPKSA